MDTNKFFVRDGIYKFNYTDEDIIFACVPSAGTTIGKLVQYEYKDGIYEKTGITYFLNCYNEGDIKSLFLNRANYEILGMLGQNYVMSEDDKFIIKG